MHRNIGIRGSNAKYETGMKELTSFSPNTNMHLSKTIFFPAPKDAPVCGTVEAVVGQQVIVQLPEDVERDATVGRRHTVVGFQQHGLKISQHQVFPQQLVRQAIALQQHFQLLQELQHQW